MAGSPFRPPPHPPHPPDPPSSTPEPNLSLATFPPLTSSASPPSFVTAKFSSLSSPWSLPSLVSSSLGPSVLAGLPQQVTSSSTTASSEQVVLGPLIDDNTPLSQPSENILLNPCSPSSKEKDTTMLEANSPTIAAASVPCPPAMQDPHPPHPNPHRTPLAPLLIGQRNSRNQLTKL